jgi:hypothetical protein
MLLQDGKRHHPEIRARSDAEPLHLRRRDGPTPWNLATGSAAVKFGPMSGVMTNWPFGLRWPEASLARNLL